MNNNVKYPTFRISFSFGMTFSKSLKSAASKQYFSEVNSVAPDSIALFSLAYLIHKDQPILSNADFCKASLFFLKLNQEGQFQPFDKM